MWIRLCPPSWRGLAHIASYSAEPQDRAAFEAVAKMDEAEPAPTGLTAEHSKRPALSRCLRTLRAGDTLIVWKLDRLGRTGSFERL